ncbi:MAG: glycoside hydrolase family 97 N-terminal domain-containing protein, partial [Muribaculaceae bacterium]|nr:glycoside hydrolase family 97 N-terminal domain-containing protein [Muribaculaceae bacterium]
MKVRNNIFFVAVATAGICQAAEIGSPSGRLFVATDVTENGTPVYSVTLDGKTVIDKAPLGLVLDFANLSEGLKEKGLSIEKVRRSYTQDKIKKSRIDVDATVATVEYEGDSGKKLAVEWHVADDGVAFRYHVPRQSGKGSMVVRKELSSFAFPAGTTTFLTSQSDPMIGWKRTKPSYEEYYVVDAPMDSKSEYGRGYTFPALFKTPDNIWALVTETGVDGYYCGSHLSDYADGRYSIAFPMP